MRHPVLVGSLLLVGLSLLGSAVTAGCGDSTAAPGATDAGSEVDAASDGSLLTPASDAGDAGPSDYTGSIFAISDTTVIDGGAKSAHRAGAFFAHRLSPDQTTVSKTVGPCTVDILGDGARAKDDIQSAGVVHLEGGLKNVDLTPKADGSYAVVTGASALWAGGETITARGEGKAVPPFQTSLKAPTKVTLTAPAAPAGTLTVTRGAGVTATFAPAASGTVVLYFDAATQTNAYSLTCTFPATSGSGVIPAAAFADFPAGGGTFDFYVKEVSEVAVDAWRLRFTASTAMVDAAGSALAGEAVFQ